MEPDGDSPPFWPTTSTSVRLCRRRSPPSFLSPVILILLLPILALLLIFFVVYPFLSHTTQFLLGPTFSVKKSWDSLNVVLVIFAILCGVFARRKEEAPPAAAAAAARNTRSSIGDRPAEPVLNSHYLNSRVSVGPGTETARSSHYVYNTTTTFESENETVSSSQWYDTGTTPVRPEMEAIRSGQWYDTSTTPARPEIETFRNGPWYDTTAVRPDVETIWSSQYWYNYNTGGVGPENQLRRNSSSYPDLRQGSFWNEGESLFRFNDLEVNNYTQSPAETPTVSDHFDGDGRRGKEDGEDPDDKVIPVDTFEVRSTSPASPPKSTPPPSPSPKEPPIDLKQQRSFDDVQREEEDEKPGVVETNADDDQLKENRSPLPAPPPPPPEPPRQRRSSHSVPRKKKVVKPSDVEAEIADDQLKENHLPPHAPPPAKPPSPPLSPEVQQVSEESHQKPQRKKSGTAKELTNVISSFYNQQKKKKRSKKKIAEESSSESSPQSTHSLPPQTPPPPPPPPPPPFKGFQNLFKKSSKSKRSQYSETSATTPPPPPPPPPPNSIFNNIFKTGNRSKRFIIPISSSAGPPPPPPPPSSILTTLFKQGSISNRFKSESSINRPPLPPPPPKPHVSSKRKSKNNQSITPTPPAESILPRANTSGKPPLPAKPSMYSDDFLNSGSQSPLITKPPPPPPFTMAEFEFVANGDFVRIRSSTSSSWCSSPGLEDVDDVTDQMVDGSDTIGPSVSCPSPDVNVKADTFISRLKDEWRLEKMNSIRKYPLGGPSPSN